MGACLARMRGGGGPGSDLNMLRQAGGQLADDALSRCEEGLPELILAHIDAGEADVSAIAEAVRTKFIDVALAGLPGAGLYVSVRGGAGPVAQGKMLRQSEEVRFSSRRASLRSSVQDRVVRALAERRRRPDVDDADSTGSTQSLPRQKDQKFSILDSPALQADDFARPCGIHGRAVIYLDIDNFKSVNTRFTERVVDRTVLPELQRIVAQGAQGVGYAYAEGGDEMVIYLPNASSLMAASLADSLRIAIAGRTFDVDGTGVTVTASFGVAASTLLPGSRLAELANQAKKSAKSSGKNRVVVWENDMAVAFIGADLFGSPIPPARDNHEAAEDSRRGGPGEERHQHWRSLLVDAREKNCAVELDSPLQIELDQRDAGGRAVRVDALLDAPNTVWAAQERTFDLGIRLRNAATATVVRVPLSQVDDIWWGPELRLHISLRKVILLRKGTSALV
jgi:diguanylate cyclase (GGDEF)-like protein